MKIIEAYEGNRDNSVNEASLGRLYQHLGNSVMVFISADRSENDRGTNKANFKELQKWVRLANFGFNKIKGGYVEKDTNTGELRNVDDENSLCVYGSVDREDELLTLGMRLGKKFKQDSILFVDSDGVAYIIYTIKDNSAGVPLGKKVKVGKFSTNTLSQYYSKIGKKTFSFKSVSEATVRSTKYTDNYEADELKKVMKAYEDDWEYQYYNRDNIEDLSDKEMKILKSVYDEEE